MKTYDGRGLDQIGELKTVERVQILKILNIEIMDSSDDYLALYYLDFSHATFGPQLTRNTILGYSFCLKMHHPHLYLTLLIMATSLCYVLPFSPLSQYNLLHAQPP